VLIKQQRRISLSPVHLGKMHTSSHLTAGSPDEVLNIELFDSLLEARVVTQDWRTIYNTIRPHGSLGGLTPAEFAQICKDKEKETVTL
jgi:transposase InsO family protein